MKTRKNDPVAVSQRVMDANHNLIQSLSAELERVRGTLMASENRVQRLHTDLDVAQTALAGLRREHDELLAAIDKNRHERAADAAQVLVIESQNTHFANLYVACYSLLAALTHRDAIDAIQQILINFVGTEDFAIVESGSAEALFVVTGGHGSGRARDVADLPIAARKAIKSGQSLFAIDGGEEIVACVPLKVEGVIAGALVIHSLLPQKLGLTPFDEEMLELLSTHAAIALGNTHARSLISSKATVPAP